VAVPSIAFSSLMAALSARKEGVQGRAMPYFPASSPRIFFSASASSGDIIRITVARNAYYVPGSAMGQIRERAPCPPVMTDIHTQQCSPDR
jgi:hypothetical protein